MREAKFKDIYDELYRRIEDGTYPAGTFLPSLSALTEQFSTSRPTIRKALQMLEEKTLISCRSGVGAEVCLPGTPAERKPLVIATDMTGLTVHHFSYAMPILDGIRQAKERYGFVLQYLDASDLERWASDRDAELPGGVILHSAGDSPAGQMFCEKIAERGVPVIFLNRFPESPKIGMYTVDYRREACRAIAHMIAHGMKSIAVYKDSPDPGYPLKNRMLGWRDAYQQSGMAVPDHLCIRSAGYREANESLISLLKQEKIDMLYITNGTALYQAVITLFRQGIRIPGDIRLLCFDNVEFARNELEIPLSYIQMPLMRMGFLAAEDIVEYHADSRKPGLRRETLDAELIINGSFPC